MRERGIDVMDVFSCLRTCYAVSNVLVEPPFYEYHGTTVDDERLVVIACIGANTATIDLLNVWRE